jgi:hypothetical protein
MDQQACGLTGCGRGPHFRAYFGIVWTSRIGIPLNCLDHVLQGLSFVPGAHKVDPACLGQDLGLAYLAHTKLDLLWLGHDMGFGLFGAAIGESEMEGLHTVPSILIICQAPSTASNGGSQTCGLLGLWSL